MTDAVLKPDLCLIVRNEAAFIGEALSGAAPFCREIVVADTGSSDGTPDIAASLGARVVNVPWRDDFAAARNGALESVTGEWILVLDADERLTPEGWRALLAALRDPRGSDCFDLPQVNYGNNPAAAGFRDNDLGAPGFAHYPGYVVSWLTRLFKNRAGFSFRGRVHEHLCRDGRLAAGPKLEAARIHHHGQALAAEKLLDKKRTYYRLGLAKAEEAPGDFKAWHELGVAAWEIGRVAEAERHFAAAARLEPRDAKNLLAWGSVLQMLGRLDDAGMIFGKLVAAPDPCPGAWGALGSCLKAQGRFDEAIDALARQVRADPDFPQARQWLAEAYDGRRKKNPGAKPALSVCYIVKNEADCLAKSLANVAPHADEIVVVDTGSTDATLDIASSFGAVTAEIPWRDDFSWARNESLKRATGEWILVLDADEVLSDEDWRGLGELMLHPVAPEYFLVQTTYCDKPTVLHWKANELAVPEAQGQSGYFESPLVRLFRNTPAVRFAGSVHEHAHHADPRVTPAMTRVRIHHYGKFRAAPRMSEKSELYRRIGEKKIREMPDEPQAYYEMAVQLMEFKRHDEVEANFLKALELNPGYGDALLAYGSFLFERGRAREAVERFMSLIRVRPSDPQVYVYTASVLAELEKYELALRLLRTARELGGESVALLLNEGVTYLRLSDFEKAETALKKALAIKPDFAPALLNLAIAAASQGRSGEAESLLRRAVASDPAHVASRRKLGELLFSSGRRRESLEAFLKARELNPGDPETLVLVVLNAHCLGELDSVKRFESELFALPKDGKFHAALARLEKTYARRGDAEGLARLAGLVRCGSGEALPP